MKSVNLLWLLLLCPTAIWAGGAKTPEIFVNGRHYDSIEDYKISQVQVLAGAASPADEEVLREKSKEMGLAFDPKNVRTIALAKPAISAQTAKEWQEIGVEHGVGTVVSDFTQNWDEPAPKFTIRMDELEGRLRAVAGDRKEPVLLISESGKLRVMALKDTPRAIK